MTIVKRKGFPDVTDADFVPFESIGIKIDDIPLKQEPGKLSWKVEALPDLI